MNILVTGARGFLGKNLCENLKTLADGRNKTRPGLEIGEIYEYGRENSQADLDRFCADCDFVVHAAGINRPKDPAEFMEGNFGFTDMLLRTLRKYRNRAPIVITSSVQATLARRFGNSEYGRSKLAGEELMFDYAAATGAPVYVYRFPNLVGKWIRPGYNSAVGTFCHHMANGLPITVNDPNVELEMLFVEDLIEELYDAMEGRPHRAEFPAAGTVIDGVTYDGVTAQVCEDGRYCWCPVTHKATLGRIVDLLTKFSEHPRTLMTPDFTEGCLAVAV